VEAGVLLQELLFGDKVPVSDASPPGSTECSERQLVEWKLEELDFPFNENVGNLVCPASYDLGEEIRLVLVVT
jgi:hypothetical protein